MLLILLILVVMALGGIHLVCVTPSVFAGVLALVTSLLVIRGCELYSALASIWPHGFWPSILLVQTWWVFLWLESSGRLVLNASPLTECCGFSLASV